LNISLNIFSIKTYICVHVGNLVQVANLHITVYDLAIVVNNI